MSESLIGILPPGWTTLTLGQICEAGGGSIQTGPFGSQLHASDYVPEGIPSVMPQNIGDNVIMDDGIARIRPSDADRLSRYLLQPGDIVYSRRGDVERRALVRREQDGWLCGTGCLRVRPGNDIDSVYLAYYLAYYLGHPRVREWIVQHAVGATMPNLNTSILETLPTAIPPRKHQDAMGATLLALDDRVTTNRRMSQTHEEILRTLFENLKLDTDHSWDGLAPISELVEFNPKRSPKRVGEAVYLGMASVPTSGARVKS